MIDIEQLPITITYGGETRKDDWPCDQWVVTFKRPTFQWNTMYYTGLGLRGPRLHRVTDGGPEPRKGTLMWERLEASRPPVKPKIADVLHALFMDADAADYNFNEWCDNYGYSSDSIKAMNMYKECLDTAQRLHQMFTKEERDAIHLIVQDL